MAVVSDDRRWVFVHIPKSGGHAVYRYLYPHAHEETMLLAYGAGYADWAGSGNIEMHSPACDIRAWMRDTDRDWDEYTSFAILRDPIDRMYSMYWEIERSAHKRDQFWWNRSSAEWWERWDECADINDFVDHLLEPYGEQPMLRPQHWYVSDGDDIIIRQFLFRATMGTEIPRLLGYPGEVPVEHKRPDDRVTLSPRSILRVQEAYAVDMDLIEEARRR